MTRFAIAFFLLSFLFSCDQKNETEESVSVSPEKKEINSLEQMEWLIGSWKGSMPEGGLGESWIKLNDSTFKGKGFFTSGKDTVSSESIELLKRGKDLLYIPTVKEQNEAQPVSFTLSAASGNTWVFENPAHDFPQKISYTRISGDSLLAEISAMSAGKLRSEKFRMKRSK